jgi:hypothetical protein
MHLHMGVICCKGQTMTIDQDVLQDVIVFTVQQDFVGR